jgi:predicted nucleotidyltransferase
MSAATSFQRLLDRLEPSTTEQAAARQHADTIWTRLRTSFNLKRPVVTGSFARGTSIAKSSDVDLFAVFSRDDARWGDNYKTSTAMLNNIKDDLQERFRFTPITIDGQAVVVDFSTSNITVDVVPAIFWGMTKENQPLYLMPDGNGWWMQTSPDAYNRYLKKANDASRGKLRRTAQLLKYWRECRKSRVAISSFHLEMLLAAHRICDGPKGT